MPDGLVLADEVAAAASVAGSLRRWTLDHGLGIGSFLPADLPAHARILHPAKLDVPPVPPDLPPGTGAETRSVRWSDVAARTGRIAHPLMEFANVSGVWPHTGVGLPGVWTREPEEGSLPTSIAEVLVDILERHTATPQHCWYCIWDGFGFDYVADCSHALTVELPLQRHCYVFRGPLECSTRSFAAPPWNQSANLWWPDDRAWFVSTDLDDMYTCVAARDDCIDELLSRKELETYRIDPLRPWGDARNPRP